MTPYFFKQSVALKASSARPDEDKPSVAIAFPVMGGLKDGLYSLRREISYLRVAIAFPVMGGLEVLSTLTAPG